VDNANNRRQMKATILQSNFAKALNMTSRIVGNRTTLPVLGNILISAKKSQIKFSATDLEVGITTKSIGKIEEEGDITLPAKLLSDFVLNNKDESIEISTEGSIASLKSDHFEASIHGIAAEEFPTIPEPPKTNNVTVNKELLSDALRKVGIAPATDETRPVLAGVFFQFEGTNLTLAATDSYRLAEKKLAVTDNTNDSKIIVPSRTINEVIRIMPTVSVDDVQISAAENQISFKVGDTYIISRLIEGSFPNYTQIIPAAGKTVVTVKKTELVSAVKMSSLFAKDTANNNVKMVVGKNEISILSAASQNGSAKSTINCPVVGDGLEIAFNSKYIVDVLNVINDENVVLEFNDNTSPGVIKSEKDTDYVYIIMPLKVEN